MEFDELRSRLAEILAVEEREPTDWLEVERLASRLQRELPIDATPEAVHHYLDDADIRSRDDAYAARQRQQVRSYVDLGEYDDGIPVPWWGALWSFWLAQASLNGCCCSCVSVQIWAFADLPVPGADMSVSQNY